VGVEMGSWAVGRNGEPEKVAPEKAEWDQCPQGPDKWN